MDDLFFYSAKIIWAIISPDTLFVILFVLSIALLWMGKTGLALILQSLLAVSVLILSLFPVGSWLLYPLEKQFMTNPDLPTKIDGIIVLGGSVMPQASQEWSQLQTNFAHERLSHFIRLAKKYPDAQLLFTGGNASLNRDQPTEADMVEDYLIGAGLQKERLRLENQARNTAENVAFSKQLLQPSSGQNWLLITTAFHMPRAVGLFCQQDWPVIPYPVDYQTTPSLLLKPGFNLLDHASNLVTAAHEWTGLLAYYLSGKIPALLPANCQRQPSQ